ncbi:MAG: glutamate racemase, partial [Chitinophagaceae bacterium]
IYLGDNGRAPYGTRSFNEVYRYTLQAVTWLLRQGCPLVILACNTASAKALRTIQQKDLPALGNQKRVLGVIRPTAEVIGNHSNSGHVGVLGTSGTVQSGSYPIEIEKYFPGVAVTQHACPMWVPLIENDEFESAGADFFIQKDIAQILAADNKIDTLLLGCTHYPLLSKKIRQFLPEGIQLVEQGKIVASSLQDYLQRHAELEKACSKTGSRAFFTTGDTADFDRHATRFFGKPLQSTYVSLY